MAPLDPAHRNILQHELDEVRRTIAELTVTEAYLARRLGIESGDDSTGLAPDADSGPSSGPTGNVADLVNPLQFYGMSITKAAEEVLTMVGRNRPLRTREIFEAVTKGGLTVKSTEIVGKMLKRSKKFHQLQRGIWGLAAWYPASVVGRGAADADLQDEADDDAPLSGPKEDTSDDEDEVTAETG